MFCGIRYTVGILSQIFSIQMPEMQPFGTYHKIVFAQWKFTINASMILNPI